MNEQNAAIKPYVIGLDLGGTNSVFGIVDARGEIKATTAIKTGGYDKVEDYVERTATTATTICGRGSEHLGEQYQCDIRYQ